MNNTDSTSFQSILAGVKRLREQRGSLEEEEEQQRSRSGTPQLNTSSLQQGQTQHKQQVIINAFNQGQYKQHGDSTNKTENTTQPVSTKPSFHASTTSRTVLVNTTQRENPLLNYLKNTSWRFVSNKPGTSSSSLSKKVAYDYLIRNRSVLFLTLSYHKLYADYISRRMLQLRHNNDNILIFVIDGKEGAASGNGGGVGTEEAVNEITRLCMFNGFTLLVGFSFEQAAKYIEYLNE